MNLQQTIEQFDQKFPNLQMVVGYGEENDRIDATLIVRSHLTSSIKKAVEEAYEDLAKDVEARKIVGVPELNDFENEQIAIDQGYNGAISDIVSLIEKKKSEFLNK